MNSSYEAGIVKGAMRRAEIILMLERYSSVVIICALKRGSERPTMAPLDCIRADVASAQIRPSPSPPKVWSVFGF